MQFSILEQYLSHHNKINIYNDPDHYSYLKKKYSNTNSGYVCLLNLPEEPTFSTGGGRFF